VLREVLEFSAAEVAAQLDMTTAAVNSALQRARAGLAAAGLTEDALIEDGVDERADEVVARYVAAFEDADVDALVTLLTDDVVLEMPPVPLWYRGREAYGRFIARVFAMRSGTWRMVPTRANGQPAVAAHHDGELHTLQVFTVRDGRVARTVVFQDAGVFAAFGLTPP
jgi:RNA polymerase sigma-70 factor (ECF subfamily)